MYKINKRFISTFEKGLKLNAVPFNITHEQAVTIFSSSRGLLENKIDGKIEKVYIPMHAASIKNISTRYSVRYGIDKTKWTLMPITDAKGRVQLVNMPHTVTKWYDKNGVTPTTNYSDENTRALHRYGDFEFPTEFVEQVVKIDDVRNKITDIVTNGEKVFTHEKKISFATDQMLKNIYTFEKKRLTEYIREKTSADHVSIEHMELVLDSVNIDTFSYHVPMYLFHAENNGNSICKIVNGYNGECAGDYVVSDLKSGLFGVITGSLLGFGSVVMFPTVPAIVAARIVIGGIVSGFTGVYGPQIYTKYKYENIKNALIADKNTNMKYVATMEDDRRQYLENTFNLKYSNFEREFDILGLDINVKLEEIDLINAKNLKLKQYHPDFNSSTKETCEILSLEISNAYSKLKELL